MTFLLWWNDCSISIFFRLAPSSGLENVWQIIERWYCVNCAQGYARHNFKGKRDCSSSVLTIWSTGGMSFCLKYTSQIINRSSHLLLIRDHYMDGKVVNLVSTWLRTCGNCCRRNFEECFVRQGHVIIKDCEIFLSCMPLLDLCTLLFSRGQSNNNSFPQFVKTTLTYRVIVFSVTV